MTENVYSRLVDHMFTLEMEYTLTKEGLENIFKENLSPLEAEVFLAFPTRVIPLQPVSVDEIIDKVDIPGDELDNMLDNLSKRGLLFSGKTKEGKKGYCEG
ncbi:hypothetical protein ACFLXG_03535 [Chloroflexota bacterium]